MQQYVGQRSFVGDTTHNVKLRVRLHNGSRFSIETPPGRPVAEALRAHGLPLKAECGGRSCEASHIHVSGIWSARLPPTSETERLALSQIPTADHRSRLAHHLTLTEELDGLEIEVPDESLEPQTFWTAG